jgi:hypothetical protein
LRVPLFRGQAPDSSDSHIDIMLPQPVITNNLEMQLDAIAKTLAEILNELVLQRRMPQLQQMANAARVAEQLTARNKPHPNSPHNGH